MLNRQWLDAAHKALPGYGASGAHPALQQSYDLNGPVTRIVIRLDCANKQQFNFPELRLLDPAGKDIPLAEAVAEVSASSLGNRHLGQSIRDVLVAKQPISSGIEMQPSLTIMLKPGTDLSGLRLVGRGRHFSRAGLNICVTAYHQGKMLLNARNNDPRAMLEDFVRICADCDLELPVMADAAAQDQFIAQLHDRLVSRIEEDGCTIDARTLLALLPVFEQEAEFTGFTQTIAAQILLLLGGQKLVVKTAELEPLSLIMSSPDRLEAIVAKANQLATKRMARDVNIVACKHLFQEPKLIRDRERFLQILDEIFPALRQCGVTPMLCYGSLLGAVRDGEFIPHDDDIDILYFDGSRSQEEMLAKRKVLSDALVAMGYVSDLNDRLVNFHISSKRGALDLFPSWQENGNLHVMLRYPQYHPVPEEVLLPTGTVSLYGHEYPAPARPKEFLAVRYGEGWSVSDPYYEWPWPLEGRAAQPDVPQGERSLLSKTRKILDTVRRRFG